MNTSTATPPPRVCACYSTTYFAAGMFWQREGRLNGRIEKLADCRCGKLCVWRDNTWQPISKH